MTRTLFGVLDLAEQHGVRVLPFKGPTLAVLLYGELALRPTGDVDVLVSAADRETLGQALLDAALNFTEPSLGSGRTVGTHRYGPNAPAIMRAASSAARPSSNPDPSGLARGRTHHEPKGRLECLCICSPHRQPWARVPTSASTYGDHRSFMTSCNGGRAGASRKIFPTCLLCAGTS